MFGPNSNTPYLLIQLALVIVNIMLEFSRDPPWDFETSSWGVLALKSAVKVDGAILNIGIDTFP